MSNHKPKGKELEAAQKIKAIMKTCDIGSSHFRPECDIEIDHTLEGVRVNGHERVISLYDVKKALTQWKSDTLSRIQSYKKALRKTESMLELLKHFRICPSCKGKKGAFNGVKGSGSQGYWVDCERCNGRGILEK